MLKEFGSMVLVVSLVSTLVATPALAFAQTRRDIKTQLPVVTEENSTLSKNLPATENLRTDMLKLVAQVRAEGDAVKIPAPQIHSPQKNNLSTGAKIAIGVGIAVAVMVVILVAQRCHNEPGGC